MNVTQHFMRTSNTHPFRIFHLIDIRKEISQMKNADEQYNY
jgi:hypothetical protein